MKPLTYFLTFFLSITTTLIAIMQLEHLSSRMQFIEGAFIFLFIFVNIAMLSIAGTRRTQGTRLVPFFFGIYMLNFLGLYIFTCWVKMLVLGELIAIIGFIVGIATMHPKTLPQPLPYIEKEFTSVPVPKKKPAKRRVKKRAKKRTKKE